MTDRLTPGQLRDLADLTANPYQARKFNQEAARREVEAPVVTGVDPSHSADATAWMFLNAPSPTAPDLDGLTYRLRARGTASDDQEWHDKDCLKAADAISTLRARAEAAEAELAKERRIVARREKTRRKALLRDIDAALAGDLKPLRLRRDLMLAPPVEIVTSNALAQGGNDRLRDDNATARTADQMPGLTKLLGGDQ